jgi:hypothetical protein
MSRTTLLDAVVSVESVWKMKTVFGFVVAVENERPVDEQRAPAQRVVDTALQRAARLLPVVAVSTVRR